MRFSYRLDPPRGRAGKPKYVLRFGGQEHVVDHVDVRVPTWDRATDRWPFSVLVGEATYVEVDGGHATIR